MKTIKQTILGIALCLLSLAVNAQCPTITNIGVTFGANGTATMTPVISGTVNAFFTNYYWQVYPSASQNSSSSQATGEFQFPANGTYSVCLNISDSLNGCWSNQYCTNITISNMAASSCNASFTAYTDSNCVTHFVNTSTGNGLTYQWYDMSTGFSLFSTSVNPSFTFSNGTHSIGLYTSSNGTFCDSLTQAITISCAGGSTNTACQASFTNYTDSNCVTHFTSTSTGSNLTYTWYINGIAYTSVNPGVNLPNGSAQVILHTYSNMQFCDSIAQYITISCNGTAPTNTCQASFYTYTDSSCVTHFINTSTSTAGSSSSHWYINGTSYYSPNVSLNLLNGTYNVALSNFTNWVFCDSTSQTVSVACSTGTTVPTGCQSNSQFYVFGDSLNTGNYFAYNFSSGTGTVSYLWNFGDGTSSTQQYPFHQYTVPGQYIICLTVTATYSTILGGLTTCSDTYCDSSSVQKIATGFLMSQLNVIPQNVTGVQQAELVTNLNAYPNPMADELTIEASAIDSKLTYVLVDAIGRTVISGNMENSKATLNTSNLAKGFYSLRLTSEKGNTLKTIKLVK